jgi:outer membrane lipoprotein-sorting protein
MKKIVILCTTIILIGVIWYFAIHSLNSEQPHKQSDLTLKEETSGDVTFEDESAARALYEKMIETMRNAQTLSYKCTHRDVSDGEEYGRSSYTIWMKKPNLFYAEAINEDNKSKGILVGNGQYAWNFWPNGRPSFRGEDYDAYKKSRFNVYMKEPAPPGKYSIGYAVVFKKSNCFPILNPSIFQGINNTLEPIMDWVKDCGVEKVGDEDCNVIEISYGNRQRSQFFWISIRDNLPRKLKDVVRANKDIITHEVWSEVTLNDEIPTEKFAWAPPENWQQWHPPGPEDKLLKPGRNAPDFELLSAAGGKIKLSDYRGKIVWLYIWRSG